MHLINKLLHNSDIYRRFVFPSCIFFLFSAFPSSLSIPLHPEAFGLHLEVRVSLGKAFPSTIPTLNLRAPRVPIPAQISRASQTSQMPHAATTTISLVPVPLEKIPACLRDRESPRSRARAGRSLFCLDISKGFLDRCERGIPLARDIPNLRPSG
jgi:hypothetical protein